MDKDYLLFSLLVFDVIIVILLILLYLKIKRFLNLPWEEIEESLRRAQGLVEKLRELKDLKEPSDLKISNPKEEIVELYQRGLKIKEIAKRTGMSEGEVELILKSKKLLP